MLAVSWINSQIFYDGIVQGLAIAVIAVGVVLVYRATRIINFAVGNMGVVGAVTLSLLVLQYNVPFWLALAIALVIIRAILMFRENTTLLATSYREAVTDSLGNVIGDHGLTQNADGVGVGLRLRAAGGLVDVDYGLAPGRGFLDGRIHLRLVSTF